MSHRNSCSFLLCAASLFFTYCIKRAEVRLTFPGLSDSDHWATSSSRRVLSLDWNVARNNSECLPGGMDPPRNVSTGTKPRSSAICNSVTASGNGFARLDRIVKDEREIAFDRGIFRQGYKRISRNPAAVKLFQIDLSQKDFLAQLRASAAIEG